ncbi:MAG TPA: hypothetical protein PLQ56_08045 [Aggregatilineales bacterium]|nr:hypothetical protein [Aggregatilineales bacterium]
MSRLLLCIILIAFFALPSLTAGQNNANALTELLFDPDCPAACFLGIIPGQTISQTDLEAYLTATGATFEKRELGSAGILVKYAVSFTLDSPLIPMKEQGMGLYYSGTYVELIEFDVIHLTLDAVLQAFGRPDESGNSGGQGADFLTYRDLRLVFQLDSTQPARIERITIGTLAVIENTYTGLAPCRSDECRTAPGIPPAFISDLDWSPDGRLLALGLASLDVNLRCLWQEWSGLFLLDTTSGEVQHWEDDSSALCSATELSFNQDGTRIVAAAGYDKLLWDAIAGSLLVRWQDGTEQLSVAWNAVSTQVAITTDPIVRRNDPQLNDLGLGMLPMRDIGIQESLTYSVWGAEDRLIITSTESGRIYVWRAEDHTVEQVFTQHTAPVWNLSWNPITNLIVSGDSTGQIWVWNPDTGEAIASLYGHSSTINDLNWRPDGTQLVSVSADETVRIWDWPSGDMQIIQSEEPAWSAAYSPDSTQIAIGGEVSSIETVAAAITILDSPSPTE